MPKTPEKRTVDQSVWNYAKGLARFMGVPVAQVIDSPAVQRYRAALERKRP